MVSSSSCTLQLIPNCYRTFIATPCLTLLRTLTTRHKTTSSIHVNSKHKNNTRRIALLSSHSSDSDAALITSSTPSSTRCSEYGRLLPCPKENFQPRIEHLVVREGGTILDFITKTLDLPPLYVADLIHFGAVFYALVCPTPPSTATPEEMKLYQEVTDPSVLKKRPSVKGIAVREAQKTFRITHVDEFVEAGTYIRVHVRPKRFPRLH